MTIHSDMPATGTGALAGAATAGKRAAILDAALDLFRRHGYAATPMPMLAEHAGVGAGTVYRYFPSKEALVNAVYQRWKRALLEALTAPLADDLPARDEFGEWWRRLWTFADEHADAFAFLETHHHAPYLDRASRALSAELSAAAVAWLRRAQRAGAVRRARPEVLLAMLYGSFVGLVKAAADGSVRWDATTRRASEDAAWALVSAPDPPADRPHRAAGTPTTPRRRRTP
jgi:TetR/AcrR family transcriptional regulator, repressor of fatR-cypB operon